MIKFQECGVDFIIDTYKTDLYEGLLKARVHMGFGEIDYGYAEIEYKFGQAVPSDVELEEYLDYILISKDLDKLLSNRFNNLLSDTKISILYAIDKKHLEKPFGDDSRYDENCAGLCIREKTCCNIVETIILYGQKKAPAHYPDKVSIRGLVLSNILPVVQTGIAGTHRLQMPDGTVWEILDPENIEIPYVNPINRMTTETVDEDDLIWVSVIRAAAEQTEDGAYVLRNYCVHWQDDVYIHEGRTDPGWLSRAVDYEVLDETCIMPPPSETGLTREYLIKECSETFTWFFE